MKLYVLNSSGELDEKLDMINQVFNRAQEIAREKLELDKVDVVFRNLPDFAVAELGVGGFTEASGWVVYISLDASKDLSENDCLATLLHELHHAKRFRTLPYHHDLSYVLIQEGLACLFEEEATGNTPIYAQQKIRNEDINKAKEQLKSTASYDHDRWFFGSKDIARWFGYSYGYKICKEYSEKHSKSAAELVNTPVTEI